MTRKKRVSLAIATLLIGTVFASISSTDAGAVPSAPVIFVGGAMETDANLQPMANYLRNKGYTVYTFPIGDGQTDIAVSAAQLNTFVNQVRAATGAPKVSFVSHSMGGIVVRYWGKYLGGSAYISQYVSMGTPHYGLLIDNLLGLLNCLGIVTCEQLKVGSTFLNDLNAGDDTPGTGRYTSIYSSWDGTVIPNSTAYLYEGGNNVSVQSKCWFNTVSHTQMLTSGVMASMVSSALGGGSVTANCFAGGL